jgi:hypothetical protein
MAKLNERMTHARYGILTPEDRILQGLGEFGHKTLQNVGIAMQKITAAKYRGGLNGEDIEKIESSKNRYQQYLEGLISGRNNLDLPEKYSHELFWEMFIMSDFDWKDEQLLNSYVSWLKEKGL